MNIYIKGIWRVFLFCLLSGHVVMAETRDQARGQSCYERALSVYEVDRAASISLFSRAAKLQHVEAMVRLARCYQTGDGTRADKRDAIDWYERAYRAGSLAVVNELAALHQVAQPKFPVNYQKAIEWYDVGVTNGSLTSCVGLSKIYASCPDVAFHNGADAVKYAEVLVRKKPSEAASFDLLAAAYARNFDFVKALKAASKALTLSSLDEAPARRVLRDQLLAGRPIPAEASDLWVIEAASRNNVWALLEMAHIYSSRLSEDYDPEEARYWYEKAAQERFPEAFVALGHYARHGIGGPVDEKKAFWCFSEAAKAGAVSAYAPLARLYVGGRGTAIDFDNAVEWFGKSAEAGVKKSRSLSGMLRKKEGQAPEGLVRAALILVKKSLNGSGGRDGSPEKVTSKVYGRFWVAAEQHDLDGMRETANMCFYGNDYFMRQGDAAFKKKYKKKPGGVARNYQQALEWYNELQRAGVECEERAECERLYLAELKRLEENSGKPARKRRRVRKRR